MIESLDPVLLSYFCFLISVFMDTLGPDEVQACSESYSLFITMFSDFVANYKDIALR